ncbi:MAG: hypothetical protein HY914_01020 [Desulfomonile tiedjei]|nr:hypothetical protein [Desulfomonile tiedjei]
MKKFLMLVTLLVFVVASPIAMAQGKEKPKKDAPKISCCVKGECKMMTKADCTKAKGKAYKKEKDCLSKCK